MRPPERRDARRLCSITTVGVATGTVRPRATGGRCGRSRLVLLPLVAAAVSIAACTGTVGTAADDGPPALGPDGATSEPGAMPGGAGSAAAGDAPGSAGTGGADVACADASVDTGAAALRRLDRQEYASSLQQLFQLPARPYVSTVPAEAERDGFTVHTQLQTLSAQHLRAYLEVATALADALLADPTRTAAVVGCELAQAGCLDDFVARFGRLAFRRPLTAEERDGILQAARANALDDNDRYRYAIEALLVSPGFLYRPELGAADGELYALSGYELASRLSFGLLGRAPDDGLLQLAADGALETPEGRALAVDTLANDPAFHDFFLGFFEQWLGFHRLIVPKEPPADWSDSLLADMEAETAAAVEQFAWGGPGFLDVLTTDQTQLTGSLATFYMLPTPGPDGAVSIPRDHPRAGAGLLTHASLLSQKSDGDRIAMRGHWLRRTFLCQRREIPAEVAATVGAVS